MTNNPIHVHKNIKFTVNYEQTSSLARLRPHIFGLHFSVLEHLRLINTYIQNTKLRNPLFKGFKDHWLKIEVSSVETLHKIRTQHDRKCDRQKSRSHGGNSRWPIVNSKIMMVLMASSIRGNLFFILYSVEHGNLILLRLFSRAHDSNAIYNDTTSLFSSE